MWAYGRTRALQTAIELRLFDQLGAGPRTAKAVAKGAKASERGVRMVFDVLAALGVVAKKRDEYSLTATSRAFLVSDSPMYLGPMLSHTALLENAWSALTETVRTGHPVRSVDQEAAGREFFPKLVASLFPASFGASSVARAALPARTRARVKKVLDVAGGSGAWSLAWVADDPQVSATLLDFREVFAVAREFIRKFGVEERYDFLEGNLRSTDFGRQAYDLVILGHICHSEGRKESQKLIKKSARALRPGGLLMIGEFVPNDSRTGPVTPLIFGINMLVNTDDGDVFTLAEYREWMKTAGLTKIRKLNLGPNGPDVIVGEKPEG
jgi:SAM-dependent methyltransferase